MNDDRYNRNEGLFGEEGQRRIGDSVAAIIGYGGLGSCIGLELAHLGVRNFRIIDHDAVANSNLNRLLGATPSDVGVPKTMIAERTIRAIQPEADVQLGGVKFTDEAAQGLIADATVVFGCMDADLARSEVLAWASEHSVPYIDTATDVGLHDDGVGWYGGRVVIGVGRGCLSCLGELNQRQLALESMSPEQREDHVRIYGISRDALSATGPSVVSINAVVGSLAVTEFMALATGLRDPVRMLTYRAERGHVAVNRDQPRPDCWYCSRYNDVASGRDVASR